MSSERIRAKIKRGIEKAGAKTGDGSPLIGYIVRAGDPVRIDGGPPVPGDPSRHRCTLVLSQYSAQDRDGTNITQRDLKAMIASDVEVEPQNGDELEIGARTFSLVNITPIMPGGFVLYYTATARGE